MEVQSENKCPNPECNAGEKDIEWFHKDICDGFGGPSFTKQNATCKKCDAEFTEYYTLVYQGTEYMPDRFENPYGLSATEDCSPRHHEICVKITEKITEMLTELAQLKRNRNFDHNPFVDDCIELMKMFRYAAVGVGQKSTDMAIAEVYTAMLISYASLSETDAQAAAADFYVQLHRG